MGQTQEIIAAPQVCMFIWEAKMNAKIVMKIAMLNVKICENAAPASLINM